MFNMLYADHKGRIYDHPGLAAGGRTGNLFTELQDHETVPLPEGASLVMIPGGRPVGVDSGGFKIMDADERGNPVFAVGALLPQGYTRTLIPAYRKDGTRPLPLFGYAAAGWKDGTIHAAALKTDDTEKWDPVNYSTPELAELVNKCLVRYQDNRIIRQLAHCALDYHCFTAQNIFYGRWEGGLPVSPVCNARCLGCISLQPAECCPSPQERIGFHPTIREIVEVALPHLEKAADAIISFGQGCEGEPSLAAETISKAIAEMRSKTGAGTINMNTNAGCTEGITAVCRAGIDSLRVSVISARPTTYMAYYDPPGYRWEDVCHSVAAARKSGVYVSLNLLTFPGLTDLPEETEALVDFIKRYDINMVQFRNLNIDPDYLAGCIPLASGEVLGIETLIDIFKEEIPGLEIGNYTRPVAR